MVRRVRIERQSLTAQLETICEVYGWVRAWVYRRHRLPPTAIGLLRRAAHWDGITLVQFRRISGVPKYTLTHAAAFLVDPSRRWAVVSQSGRERLITTTPTGRAYLKQLDLELTRMLHIKLKLDPKSEDSKLLAEAIGSVASAFPVLTRQPTLYTVTKHGPDSW